VLNSDLVEFVDSAQASPPDAPKLSLSAQIVWAVLIIATLYVCYFSHLGAIGFVGPDEPRYAWIARDMAESGDWVTPRLYGKPWFEKPPLYYWCAALSFKIFGVSEAAARLPSAIAALLATLALAWLALRLYGAETARWLLLLLPSSVGMIGFSHAASTDMLFSATLTLAVVAAAIALGVATPTSVAVAQHAAPDLSTSVPSRVLSSIFLGLFLGLAMLAKGPAALILLGGTVFFWAIFTKRWRDASRLFHPLAIAAFCLTALPWYILCARRNPEFFRIFIIEHNFKRYLTPEFQHIQPFWYYAAVLLIALLPWTALLLWSVITGAIRLWRTRKVSDATLLLLCWSAFCILFFSISKSKLPGYILPAIPVIVLLANHSRFALTTRAAKALALVNLGAALIFSACFAITESVAPHVSQGNIDFGIAAGLVFGVLSVANLLLGVGLRPASKARSAAAACCVLPILLTAAVNDGNLRSLFYWDPSGKTIARELQQLRIPQDALAIRAMNRGQRYSLDFYLGREIPEWDQEHLHDGYLLSGSRFRRGTVGEDFTCEEVPFDLQKTGFFLYRIKPRLVGGAADGRKVE
jgi:4-amino-4-deoxy-L-arabinose transferase-like glycosyltransferase